MRCLSLSLSLSLCFSFTLPLYDLPFFLHLLSLFILCASSAALAEKPKTKKKQKQNWKWQQSRSSGDSSRGSGGGSSTVDVRSISFWLMCFLLSQRQRRCCCDWQRCVFLPTYAFTFCVCIIIPNCVCSTHSLTHIKLTLSSFFCALTTLSLSPDSLKESHAQNKNKRKHTHTHSLLLQQQIITETNTHTHTHACLLTHSLVYCVCLLSSRFAAPCGNVRCQRVTNWKRWAAAFWRRTQKIKQKERKKKKTDWHTHTKKTRSQVQRQARKININIKSHKERRGTKD